MYVCVYTSSLYFGAHTNKQNARVNWYKTTAGIGMEKHYKKENKNTISERTQRRSMSEHSHDKIPRGKGTDVNRNPCRDACTHASTLP